MKLLRTAALVLAVAWPGLARAQPYTPTFDGLTVGATLFTTPAQVWSGSTISPGFRGILQQSNFSGSTAAAGEISLNAFTVNSDTLHATAANSSVRGWDFEHNGPAGYIGDRAALFTRFNQVGTSGNKAAGRGTSTMVGAGLAAQASFSEGGTGTTAATSYGLIFGANILASLNSGATNFNEAHGLEINLTAATGSSVYKKTMAQIISAGLDTVKGASGNDVALVLGQREAPGGASPAAYYDTGLQFGDVDSSWPYGPSASLIAAREPQNGGLASSRNALAGFGVNFGAVEFATAAWQSIGSKVDGSGNASFQTVNVGNWTLSTTAGSLSIASTMQQTATMAIHAAGGGANWLIGDKFTFGTTGVGKVTGNSAGVATAITILEPDLQATPPGNPVATAATNVSDGRVSGTGLTIDETWTATGGGLSVGGTGPITGFGTAIGQAPQFINWNGSGFPGLHLGSRLILDQTSPAATDFTMLQLTRTSAFTGGSGLFNSLIRSVASIGAGDATDNWGIASLMSTSGNSGGEATAGFFQTRALAGSTDFNITMISDYRDETNLGTLASGTSGGGAHEFDLEANGPDDGINALSLGGVGVRKMQHLVAVRLNAANTTQTEVSHGIWGSTQTGASGPADAHTNYGSFIGFSLNTQIRNGLDTRLAIPPAGSANPVAAVTMKSGHVIDFNGSVSSITAAPGNYLWYDTSVSRWKYTIAGVDKFSIDASGNVRAAGTVTGSTTP